MELIFFISIFNQFYFISLTHIHPYHTFLIYSFYRPAIIFIGEKISLNRISISFTTNDNLHGIDIESIRFQFIYASSHECKNHNQIFRNEFPTLTKYDTYMYIMIANVMIIKWCMMLSKKCCFTENFIR